MISQQRLADLNKNLIKISREKIQAEATRRGDPDLRRLVGASNTLDSLTSWMVEYIQLRALENLRRSQDAGTGHHGAHGTTPGIEHGEVEEIGEDIARSLESKPSEYIDVTSVSTDLDNDDIEDNGKDNGRDNDDGNDTGNGKNSRYHQTPIDPIREELKRELEMDKLLEKQVTTRLHAPLPTRPQIPERSIRRPLDNSVTVTRVDREASGRGNIFADDYAYREEKDEGDDSDDRDDSDEEDDNDLASSDEDSEWQVSDEALDAESEEDVDDDDDDNE